MADRASDRSSRVEQPADPADVQAVGYGPGDVVQVPERYADLHVHKEKSGRADRWNDDLMAPEPSSVYVVDDRYLYATDRAGRVTHAEGWLGWLPSKENDERRNVGAQRQAGEPDVSGPTMVAICSVHRSTVLVRRSTSPHSRGPRIKR